MDDLTLNIGNSFDYSNHFINSRLANGMRQESTFIWKLSNAHAQVCKTGPAWQP
jgi:hypothetical protein